MTTTLHPVPPQGWRKWYHNRRRREVVEAPTVFPVSIGGKRYQVVEQGRIPAHWNSYRNERGEIDTVRTLPIPLLLLLFVEVKS